MRVINYDYIQEISAEDALKNSASDVTSGYNGGIPGVNTFKINAETSVYNEQGGGSGIAGWSTDISWTPGVGSISWTSGNLSLPDGTQVSVSSGSASISAPTYIYCDTTDGTVHSTTHSYEAVGENKIMICAAFPNSGKNVTFKAFGCADQNSAVTGADIAAGTIVASNIASGTITANQIASGTITANEIASNTITASEMNVSRLSAISANLGDITAGTITGTTITAGNTSSSAVRMYPSGSSGYLQFYYSGSTVGTIQGQYVSGVGNTVAISGTNIALDGKVWCLSKLRIPVGTNMY